MVIAVLIAVAVVVLGGGGAVLWRFELQYAAEIQTVSSPVGRRATTLSCIGTGVMVYPKREGVFNANSIFPTAIALMRRWRRGLDGQQREGTEQSDCDRDTRKPPKLHDRRHAGAAVGGD